MIDFDDMNELPGQKPVAKGVDPKKASIVNGGEAALLPCPKCRGTGQTRWGPCFSCQGKGKRSARSIGASQATVTRADNLRNAFAEWQRSPVGAWCLSNQEWNEFARKMIDVVRERGQLTENQEAAIVRSMAKQVERRAQANAAKPVVAMSAIDALFATAAANGLKRPRFVAGAITLSLAPATGRNPGAIYVKENGEYAGKIANGVFSKAYSASPKVAELVEELAADPKGTAVRYGRSTGTCCCCGRELTDADSVAAGIGPVCAENWGF